MERYCEHNQGNLPEMGRPKCKDCEIKALQRALSEARNKILRLEKGIRTIEQYAGTGERGIKMLCRELLKED